MIKAGIIGGSGYTAGELLRLLVHHPKVEIDFVYSTTNAGKSITSVHTDLLGVLDLKFSAKINPDINVVFLCLGHGNSTAFLEKNTFSESTKVIDLSQDFRHQSTNTFQGKTFVYGLPEINKKNIFTTNYIANPGCFASGIQLALLPLAEKKWLQNPVHVHAITGSTGAGVSLKSSSHFSWRNNNISVYKTFSHQHLKEINERLQSLQPSWNLPIHFIPMRGDFPRGIFSSVYTECDIGESHIIEQFKKFYKESPFVHVSDSSIDLKQIINTNNCVLHIEKHNNQVLITSAIDNLLKGASGQAVQNMNLMFGLDETTGLQLKSSAF